MVHHAAKRSPLFRSSSGMIGLARPDHLLHRACVWPSAQHKLVTLSLFMLLTLVGLFAMIEYGDARVRGINRRSLFKTFFLSSPTWLRKYGTPIPKAGQLRVI